MMFSLDKYKEAFVSLPQGAKEAEVNAESHKIISVAVTGGSVADIQVSESTELFIRVSGEKTGYAYTQNAAEDAAALLKMAYENGAISDKAEPDHMSQEPLRRVVCEEAIPEDPEVIKGMALALEAAAKNKLGAWAGKCNVFLTLKAETYGQHTVNSHGLDVSSSAPCYIAGLHCAAAEAYISSEIVTSAPAGFDPEGEQIAALVADVVRRLDYQTVKAEGFVSGEQEVILSEAAVSQLFMTAWQEFSAAKYADGACCLKGMMSEKISSELLTITDETSPAEGGYPAFADAEGCPGRRITVVEKGILKDLLSNQTSAAALGLVPSGNAGRRPLMFGNIATDILVTPKNFCIEPGDSTLEEMEEHMGDGILITEYFDLFHSLDISSGNFSVPCYGVLIRDGKETGTVFGLNLSGNFRQLLAQVKEVGMDRQIHPMDFLNNYGIGSCPLAVGRLTVSGE